MSFSSVSEMLDPNISHKHNCTVNWLGHDGRLGTDKNLNGKALLIVVGSYLTYWKKATIGAKLK